MFKLNDSEKEILEELFSKARMLPYFKQDDTKKLPLAHYHENIIVSEAMLLTLHYFEVCLRNRIDKIIKSYFGSDWILTSKSNLLISGKDLFKIKEIIMKLSKTRGVAPSHDDIIGQMTFGFWCAFFHKKYDPILWHKKDSLKKLFPYMPRKHRSRAYVEPIILKIKEIRNRIAHHEPVCNQKITIVEVYYLCQELIRAMSTEASSMLVEIDRFPSVCEKLDLRVKC